MSIRAMPPFDVPQAPPLGLLVPKAISIYSVEDAHEALKLIDLAGELTAESGRWIYPNFARTVEALDDVADHLHRLYREKVRKDKPRAKRKARKPR
jgi:hypothetical protein